MSNFKKYLAIVESQELDVKQKVENIISSAAAAGGYTSGKMNTEKYQEFFYAILHGNQIKETREEIIQILKNYKYVTSYLEGELQETSDELINDVLKTLDKKFKIKIFKNNIEN
jgi:hypothetical protein